MLVNSITISGLSEGQLATKLVCFGANGNTIFQGLKKGMIV